MLPGVKSIDWANRWIGGFCAVAAAGGLPVRGADYQAHQSFAASLLLRPAMAPPAASQEQVCTAWSQALAGATVVLVRSVARARELLLLAAQVEPGELVGVPANASRGLVESIKQAGARPLFCELDAQLAPRGATCAGARCSWAQLVGGVGGTGDAAWVDCADTLPGLDPPEVTPAATLFGLHLTPDPGSAGALLVFGDAALARAVMALLQPEDVPHPGLTLAQLHHLCGTGAAPGLARRQVAGLAETRRGLLDAAGLALLPASDAGALAHHVAVRIPDESDPATFYAYVRAEQTPVRWLPEVRPLHYAAVRAPGRCAATAAELARWLLVPVGPEYTDEEIAHAVLGVVKVAECLGVRWRTDQARAAAYAALMDELYGPGHDAYRPVFSGEPAQRRAHNAQDV